MKIHEVMSHRPESIQSSQSIEQAAARMRDLDIGVMPVESNGKIVGMVTDRDITIRGVAAGADSRATKVRDVMTRAFVWCDANADVADAEKLMGERQIRRLPVIENNKVVGILSLGDLATKGAPHTGEVLAEVSRPH